MPLIIFHCCLLFDSFDAFVYYYALIRLRLRYALLMPSAVVLYIFLFSPCLLMSPFFVDYTCHAVHVIITAPPAPRLLLIISPSIRLLIRCLCYAIDADDIKDVAAIRRGCAKDIRLFVDAAAMSLFDADLRLPRVMFTRRLSFMLRALLSSSPADVVTTLCLLMPLRLFRSMSAFAPPRCAPAFCQRASRLRARYALRRACCLIRFTLVRYARACYMTPR